MTMAIGRSSETDVASDSESEGEDQVLSSRFIASQTSIALVQVKIQSLRDSVLATAVQATAVCNLTGVWRNGIGSELHLSQGLHGHMSGKYRTAVESTKGASGGRTYRTEGTCSTQEKTE